MAFIPEWTDRTIRGPLADFLTYEEFGKLFGVSADTVMRQVKAGEVPAPIEVSSGTKLFSWEHVVYHSLRCKLRPYFASHPTPGKGRKDSEEEV